MLVKQSLTKILWKVKDDIKKFFSQQLSQIKTHKKFFRKIFIQINLYQNFLGILSRDELIQLETLSFLVFLSKNIELSLLIKAEFEFNPYLDCISDGLWHSSILARK